MVNVNTLGVRDQHKMEWSAMFELYKYGLNGD